VASLFSPVILEAQAEEDCGTNSRSGPEQDLRTMRHWAAAPQNDARSSDTSPARQRRQLLARFSCGAEQDLDYVVCCPERCWSKRASVEQVRSMAVSDPLTGLQLPALISVIEAELDRSRRTKPPVQHRALTWMG